MKPHVQFKQGPRDRNPVSPHGIDDSMFKTFTKNKKNRQKNKAARKQRKQNRK